MELWVRCVKSIPMIAMKEHATTEAPASTRLAALNAVAVLVSSAPSVKVMSMNAYRIPAADKEQQTASNSTTTLDVIASLVSWVDFAIPEFLLTSAL